MKKKILLLSLLLVSVFALVGCGGGKDSSKNALVGKWKGLTDEETRENQIETTFTFKSNNKVTYENEFGYSGSGTYEIKGDQVTLNIDLWDQEKVYKFKVEDNKLSLEATDRYSPSYSELIKQ